MSKRMEQVVWVPEPKEGFVLASIVDLGMDEVTVQPIGRSKSRFTLPLDRVYTADPHFDDKDVDDNCSLMHLNEATLLNNVKIRYSKDKIYTYVANILISVNPYIEIKNLYSTDVMEKYKGKSLGVLPPHIFAIADKSFRDMKVLKQSQSVIVSGESGAGKTESTKHLLRYLCYQWGSSNGPTADQKILDANPVLEAFGNAKTTRNNNSSRFGKFMEVHFDNTCSVVGGYISHYLLEKSRVCIQSSEERNYHVFYLLCAGAPSDLRNKLSLANPDAFNYLKKGCTQYFTNSQTSKKLENDQKSQLQNKQGGLKDPMLDDVKGFSTMDEALSRLGLSNQERCDIYTIVAAVLHLGNIEFEENIESTKGGCKVTEQTEYSLSVVAKLLSVDFDELRQALITKVMMTNRGGLKGTVIMVPLKQYEANNARDALAKAIYGKLFDNIVNRINSSIPSKASSYYIGVLDIAGFEYFTVNSFEQFCINYCNEKLQQLFIDLVLRQEQEEYQREGIAWQEVKYFNNQVICDLVEKPHLGIIAILDEACLNVGKINDEMLLEAMDIKLSKHEHYSSRQVNTLDKDLKHKIQFKIRHYAGDVVYNIYGFLEKNKDTLFQDFKRLLYSSNNSLIKDMWPEGALDIKSTTKRPVTAGNAFKTSMIALVKTLNSKMPYYVRCIKPNEKKSPVGLDYKRVVHQVSYLGLLENVRVRRAGFAHRQSYSRFLKRYKMISGFTWPNYQCSDKEATRALIDENQFSNDVKYGKTKLFIRSPQTLFTLEKMRAELIPAIVILLQKQWRGAICRAKFRKMKAAYFIIKFYRHYKIRTYIQSVLKAHKTCEMSAHHKKSIIWPQPNFAVRQLEPSLKSIYKRWKAFKLLNPYLRSEWPQLRCKVYAASLLWGKRPSWGGERMWRGDYLSSPTENVESANFMVALNNLKNSDRFNQVLFSSFIHKTNRFNKCADRAILITDWAIYKLDITKFKPMKKGMPIQEVTGMSVSPGQDQLVVIHSNRGNDLVVTLKSTADSSEDRIGELIGVISTRYFQLRNSELPVNVSNKFNCMLGKKSRLLRVEVNPQTSTASFRKDDNDGIVYIIPSNVVHPFIKA